MDVKGRSVVVTGAAGGIGEALAVALLERGARVVLSDRDGGRLGETAARLADLHPAAVAEAVADASSEDDLRRVLDVATAAHGPVSIFFANAGIFGKAEADATDAQWRQALDVNLMAHVRAARLLVPGWLERGEGHFVSTASAAGLLTQIGSVTYSVSKHAAVSFAEWLAVTYGAQGVRVTCVCPMGVDTALLDVGRGSDDPAEQRMARAVTEAGEVLTPKQVADVTLDAVEAERFLVLPHERVQEFRRRKVEDVDRWIAGMQHYAKAIS